jgi:hypothetical protein
VGEAVGEIELEDNVLVIRRIHVRLLLRADECQGKVESSGSQQSRKFRFQGSHGEVRGSLSVPAKRRRALVATNPIEE